MKEVKYCPKCGKLIDTDSSFCTHCGLTLNSSVDTNLCLKRKNNQRIGLAVTGVWVLIHICFLVTDSFAEGERDETLWFFDSDFTDFYAYGLGEFVFWGLLVPAIIWSVVYIFQNNKKNARVLFFVLATSLFIFWGIGKYKEFQIEQEQKKQEELSKIPIINREFFSCTLGEDYVSVLKKIKKEHNQFIVDSLSTKDSLVLSNVTYGSRVYDRMKFGFYKGKLYQVYFQKNYNTEDEKLNAYRRFQEIFEQKDYPQDPEKYNKYNNTLYYLDKHTELKLRYSVYQFDWYDEYVQIVYYDLNSHQKDDGL